MKGEDKMSIAAAERMVEGMESRSVLEPSVKMMEVTPLQAEKWLQDTLPEFQRTIRDWHVDELGSYMKKGQFKLSSIEFCDLDGTLYLTDGQHRLHAITRTRLPQMLIVVVTHVKDMDEVRHQYARTDNILARTTSDAARALDLPAKSGLNSGWMTRIVAATRLISRDFGAMSKAMSINNSARLHARSRDTMEKLVLDWKDEAGEYADIIGTGRRTGRGLRTSSCVAVGLATLRYQRPKARQFWQTVAANDGVRAGTAEHKLVELLLTRTQEEAGGEVTFARLVAACWNAYYTDRHLSKLYARDTMLPILIEGTPWRGR